MAEENKLPITLSELSRNPIVDEYNNFEETTYFRSPLVSDSYKPPYNPDDIWQKTGDYSIYESMAKDDQVSVCLRLKKDLILGDGGYFKPGDSDQEQICDFLNEAFSSNYGGDFESDLEEILTSYEFGFSITEKIFEIKENQMLGIKGLRTRHPNSWRLHQDDKGAITKYEQITSMGNLDVNPKSIIHLVNDPKFQNPYGNSDLRTAYLAWFTKKQIIKWYAIFMEKAASPVPVGRYDKNAPKSAIDFIFNALKSFQSKTTLVIPKEIEVEFLEATSSGEVYTKALHFFNMVIGRSLFIPDLLGFTGSETGGGSLALGKEQMGLFFKHIQRRRKALELVINRELAMPIINYNFGFLKNPPKYCFKPLNDFEALEYAKIWLDAVKGNAFKPNPEEINHFRKLVKFPEGEVLEKMAPPSLIPGQDPNETEEPEMEEVKEKESKEEESKESEEKEPEEKKEFAKGKVPPGEYYKKVDFKAMKAKLDDYDKSIINEMAPVVSKMVNDLFDQIDKKKIVQGQKVDRIESLNLKYKKELKQILKSSFIQLYKDAKSQASSEILKGVYAKSIANDQFLEIIESETFQFIGDYEYTILKRVRAELIAAIKDGKSLATIQDILTNELMQLSQTQLDRFARTKHTEVMNNARVDFFNESGVVVAYQYSAILDDATSEICSSLDGKIFEKGNEPIPPLHFNCRSTLVPITKYEEYKADTKVGSKDINAFIEENKGTGFAKHTIEQEPVKIKPKITDPGVSFKVTINGNIEKTEYSLNGELFHTTLATYEDETRKKLIGLDHVVS